MICSFFKFSILDHFFSLKMYSLGGYKGCFDVLYVFRAPGLIWRENLKNEQNEPKLQNITNLCHLTLTAYICGKLAPHPYVSYIFRNLLISSFTLSSLNLFYVVKITRKLRFKKKYRFFANYHYFGPDPHCKWSDFKILCLLVQFFV